MQTYPEITVFILKNGKHISNIRLTALTPETLAHLKERGYELIL